MRSNETLAIAVKNYAKPDIKFSGSVKSCLISLICSKYFFFLTNEIWNAKLYLCREFVRYPLQFKSTIIPKKTLLERNNSASKLLYKLLERIYFYSIKVVKETTRLRTSITLTNFF